MAKNIREVSPFLQRVRDFLLGRPSNLAVRFQDDLATRSPPLPDLPDGPSHRLASNYYYTRDARREAVPPEVIAPGQKMIATGESAPDKPLSSRTPGTVYRWD